MDVALHSFNSNSFMTLAALLGICTLQSANLIEWLHERTEHLDIFHFPPITQWCPVSDVLFTGGRGVSDFSVLKYY